MIRLYELGLLLVFALYLPKALLRRRLPHAGWSMRLGRYPAALRERLGRRDSIWLHAVSVGETMAARPLVTALAQRYPHHDLVLSTVTATGFQVATQLAESLGGRGIAVYFPLDVRGCVRRAFEAIQPRLLILMESELWPVAIREAQARRIPVAVVNGRISPTAFRRYRRVRSWLRGMLDGVSLFVMKSEADAQRMRELGADPAKVRVLGSLKWDASLATRPSAEELKATAARLGLRDGERVIVAGSTHRGEEAALLEAHQRLREASPSRLMIAPRHPERVGEVEALMTRAGLRVARASEADARRDWDGMLIDTMGQLPRYYGVATVVFVGGSLIPHGGQNPLEAASLGKPIVFGPFMHNFDDIAQPLIAQEAAVRLNNPQELPLVLEALLADPSAASAMGRRAQTLTERSQGVVAKTLEALSPLLANIQHGGAA